MTSTFQSKATMTAAKELPDPAASQGARRATEDAAGATRPTASTTDDMEVVGRAKRRVFSSADKRRILSAADRCTQPGELGAMLRREGVYSSSLSTWKRQREASDMAALAPQQRGPKVDPHRAETLHIAQLTRENEKLKRRLENAMLVIDVQKKLAALMGITLDENGERI
jgi:transposase